MPSSTVGNSANPNWFVAAVQTLVFLAHTGEVCSSGMIADYVQAHPTFLRRVISQLVRAGLVLAHEGREGGYCLARPADCVTLAEVYQAIKPRNAGLIYSLDAIRGPVLTNGLRVVLGQVIDETEQGVIEVLHHHTIAEIAAKAEALEQPAD